MTDFAKTREALRVYDDGKKQRDLKWEALSNTFATNADLEDALKMEEDAKALVHAALFEDTKHVNSLDHCKLVHPDDHWLRNLVARGA